MVRPRNESIRCKYCGCGHCPVRHTKQHTITFHGRSRTIIRRFRVCRNCQVPFTTIETYEDEDQELQPEVEAPPPTPQPIQDWTAKPMRASSPSPKKFPGPRNPFLETPKSPPKRTKPKRKRK